MADGGQKSSFLNLPNDLNHFEDLNWVQHSKLGKEIALNETSHPHANIPSDLITFNVSKNALFIAYIDVVQLRHATEQLLWLYHTVIIIIYRVLQTYRKVEIKTKIREFHYGARSPIEFQSIIFTLTADVFYLNCYFFALSPY